MRAGHLGIGVGALLALGVAMSGAQAAPVTGPAPSPPRQSVDTALPPTTGRVIAVPAGGDLQEALNRAEPGDVITLAAGATFTGPFELPRKAGSGWIVVRTSAPDKSLPAPGTRVDPSAAPAMPKLEAARGSVIDTATGAHHYRFIGIEIRPRSGAFLTNLVQLGAGETSPDALPHHIIFDRCYLHGDPERGSRRGIALNARSSAVVDSYLADFKEVGADSQAIAAWNGPGPFKIQNDYVEAAGEGLMFGGGDPSIPNLVPSDIEIRGNHVSRPLSWKEGEPGYEGKAWTVKNLLELKNARRVLIQGNLFEHHWAQAQSGFAILFTVRNQDGSAPWSVVEDVTFADNIVRHAAAGINMHGRDDLHPSQQTRRVAIRNNLFEDIGGPRWGGNGTLFQIINGTANVVIEHNTAVQTGKIIMTEGPAPQEDFVFRANLVPHNEYGIIGTGTGPGRDTLDKYFPGAVVEGNVIAGGSSARYPRSNLFPGSLDDVGFRDRAHGDYRLGDGSRYKKAAGGADPGVDAVALVAARAAEGRSPSGR